MEFAVIVMMMAMGSCSLTKYVADDEMLLDKVHIEGDRGHVSMSDLQSYVRQQPNTRFLHLWRVGLGTYSLSRDNDRGINRWLRRIGQEPVPYSAELAAKDAQQLERYLVSRGFYDAVVTDTVVKTRRKRCEVTYRVNAGRVYRIHSIKYSVPDDEVGRIVLRDTVNSLLRVGDPFDEHTYEEERERVTALLQERGYRLFGKDYIELTGDSAGLDHAFRDSLVVSNFKDIAHGGVEIPHRRAVVDSLVILVDQPSGGVDSGAVSVRIAGGASATYTGRPKFRDSFYRSKCFIVPDSLYRLSDDTLSRSRLMLLKAIRQASFEFVGRDSVRDTLEHVVCVGRISTNKRQSFGADIEGTNSSGNLGAAVALRYTHANVFRGAEALSVKTRFALQNQSTANGKGNFSTLETGVEMGITFPFMIAPINSTHFYKHHNPETIVSFSYDYQRRPEFTRNVLATRMTYKWRGSKYAEHSLTPVEFNIVRIPTLDETFARYIDGTYLEHAYTDHFIMSLGYVFCYKKNKINLNQSGAYVRVNVETAGNVLNLCTSKQETGTGYRTLWDIRFAQYTRMEAEFSYCAVDLFGNSTVFRFFGGIGVPYGNSSSLPYEKSFFVGGANSIRAWPVRGLGPGSAAQPSSLRYHNQIGDIRLEANAEYRFKIISAFEGAVFVDAGNIWTLDHSGGDEAGNFTSGFYRQIALGTGLGVRLNFDYFVFRVDAGYKIHDPQEEGDKWVIKNRFSGKEIAWNFAIGYPF